MARVLLVAPPLAGHIAPLRGVAGELRAHGHQVAWAGPARELTDLAGPAEPLYPAGSTERLRIDDRPAGLRGYAALEHLWQNYLIPLADSMAEGVDVAVREFAPDVLLVDQQAMAGALAAMRYGLPWATSASTSAELTDPLAAMPKVARWVDGLQQELLARHGIDAPAGTDLRFSPELVLVFSTEELAGPPARTLRTGTVRFVGPVLVEPARTVEFPAHLLRPQVAMVLVTLGTVNAEAGARFLRAAADALRGLSDRFQGVFVDPAGTLTQNGSAPSGLPGVLAVRRIPQLELIRRASVVLCHAGHNTVCESLANAVPLVVAPIRDDQPIVAQQVVRAGAGRRLRFDRAEQTDIATAVRTVYDTPEYRAGAERVRASFRDAGGAPAAARSVLDLGRSR